MPRNLCVPRRLWEQRCGTGGDAGDSLIEIVIAIVLLGGVVAALLTALVTEALASTSHRKLATVDTILRSYAEATNKAVRLACTKTDGTQTFTVTYTPPGYPTLTTSGTCPATSTTLPVTLQVIQPLAASMTIVVRTP